MIAVEPGGVRKGLPGELEAFAHGGAAGEGAAEQLAACHRMEHAVVGHERHQRVEVVGVPGVGERLEEIGIDGAGGSGHGAGALWDDNPHSVCPEPARS